MRVIRGIPRDTVALPSPVLTLGNFDGVHLGHQAILKRVTERARAIGGTAVVFTFEPHPLKVLAPQRSPRLLNTPEAKLRLFEAAGIDVVIVAEFTREFANQNPEDFVLRVLHDVIGVKEIYVGYNYAFGKRREGSIGFLTGMGERLGFSVGVVGAVVLDGTTVSSSRIRDLIASGRVSEAARFLGRQYSLEGEVVSGSHRGRTLGFPTANLSTPNELIPAHGVYAVQAAFNSLRLDGVASLGVRPTFGGGPVSIEIYLFEFHEDLYGKQMEVFFVDRLRGEQRFPDVDSLVRQMHRDVEQAKHILAHRYGRP